MHSPFTKSHGWGDEHLAARETMEATAQATMVAIKVQFAINCAPLLMRFLKSRPIESLLKAIVAMSRICAMYQYWTNI
jgi:hypothetical protein